MSYVASIVDAAGVYGDRKMLEEHIDTLSAEDQTLILNHQDEVVYTLCYCIVVVQFHITSFVS